MDESKLIPVAVVRTIRLGGKALIPVELSHAVGGQKLKFSLDHRNRQVADLTRFEGEPRRELLAALRSRPKSWTLLGADGEPFVEPPDPALALEPPMPPAAELPAEAAPVDALAPAPEPPATFTISSETDARRGRGKGRRA